MLDKITRTLFLLAFFILFIALSIVGIKENTSRSYAGYGYEIDLMQKYWSKIPQDKAVFPNILFRPLGYPITAGDDEWRNPYPSIVRQMLPLHFYAFEKEKLPFLIIEDPVNFFALEPGLESYINDHYQKIDGDNYVWKRIK